MGIPRICNHIKPDGTPCRDVAAGRARLCRSHQRQAARDHRRTLALNSGRTVRLGPLATRAEALRTLNRVLQLTAAGTLPVDRAGHALCRINLALAALKNPARPSPAARSAARVPHSSRVSGMSGPRPELSDIDLEQLLNSFTAAYNPLTMELGFAPASPITTPLDPRTLHFEPSLADLLSLIQPPTIEAIPAASASLSTRSRHSVASPSRQRPPVYPG